MSIVRRAAVRWALAVALVGVVVSRFDLEGVADRLASADPVLAMSGIGGLVAAHLIGALTWRRLADRLVGIRLDPRSTIRLYYAAQALGAVTPGNLGADVYRVVAVDAGAGRASVALPIVVQRVTSTAALLALGALGAMALPIAGGAPLVASVGLVLACLAAAALVLAVSVRRGGRFARLLRGRLGLREGELAGSAVWSSAVRDGLGLGLVFHAVSLILGLALVAAVDVDTANRPLEVLAALAVARLSLAVPISPSGLGIQEGVLALLFVALGLAPEVALAAVLLNRVALVGVVGGGALALLAGPTVETRARVVGGWPTPTTDR